MKAKRTVQWLVAFAATAGVMIGQLVVAAPTATAGPVAPLVPQLQRVELASATDGVSPKQVTVTCPAGTRVYTAAGRINGGVGAVVLDDLTANDALTTVRVTARVRPTASAARMA